MASASPSASSHHGTEVSISQARSSGRTRVKTQRAIESEHVDRLFAQAKARQTAQNAPGLDGSSSSTKLGEGSNRNARVKPTKNKVKGKEKSKKEAQVYCICKTDGEDGRPMIECGTCKDWFHFDCVNLTDEEAELTHEYICPSCEVTTGRKTTHIYDIEILPSPSPPPGVEPPIKRKLPKKSKPSTKPISSSPEPGSGSQSPSSDDDASEANDTGGSNSESGSESASSSKPAKKRVRTNQPPGPTRSSMDRKPSIDHKRSIPTPIRQPSKSGGALPPARLHVLNKMSEMIRTLFEGKLNASQAETYGKELEMALWNGFKEMIGGKEAVGSRYKAQFNLLSSSLSKSLRPELRSTILDRSLTPAQVAVLTPADLASAERREEIEAAKQAVLQQHVKSKEDQTSAIRLGRDGLERAEDLREKEMKALAAAEEVAREKEKRRESLVSQSAGIEGVDNDEIQTPITPRTGDDETKVHSPSVPAASSIGTIGVVGAQGGAAVGGFVSPAQGLPRGRSDSADVHRSSIGAMHSPVITSPSSKTFALKSAWGGGPDTKRDTAGVDMESFGGDQSALDLSHILAEGGDVRDVLDVAMETAPKEEPPSLQSDMDRFLARSVVWSGKLINPAKESSTPPPFAVRLISSVSTTPNWSLLLPRSPVEFTGRVPTSQSLQYISDSRLAPSKQLIVVALTLSPQATPQEKVTWTEMIDFHVNKDRYGVYVPHGHKNIPPGGAKELYMIPMRPTDPSPEFTDLIDGFDFPSQGRVDHVFLGVFILNREVSPISVPAPPPAHVAATNPPPIGPSAATPIALPNEHLQALMASLNPRSIPPVGGIPPPQGPTGANSPLVHTQPPPPPLAGYTAQPRYPHLPPAYPAQPYAPPPAGHYSQAPYDRPSSRNYAPRGPGGHVGHGGDHGESGRGRGDERGWNRDMGRGQDRSPDRRRSGGREWERDRDSGWASRGGGRGRY